MEKSTKYIVIAGIAIVAAIIVYLLLNKPKSDFPQKRNLKILAYNEEQASAALADGNLQPGDGVDFTTGDAIQYITWKNMFAGKGLVFTARASSVECY